LLVGAKLGRIKDANQDNWNEKCEYERQCPAARQHKCRSNNGLSLGRLATDHR
jgi:hypothetical protein